MLGAILGDIAGSRFEFSANRVMPNELFDNGCFPTDDTYLTLAVSNACCRAVDPRSANFDAEALRNAVLLETLRAYRAHPDAGWGSRFSFWASSLLETMDSFDGIPTEWEPNQSAGNGAAMKVSPIPYSANSLEMCKELTHVVTSVTHDHEDSYKAAECLTTSMYLALHGSDKDEIKANILSYYPEVAEMSYAKLQRDYAYSQLARDTLPAAMVCFLDSTSFEEALKMAISIGGDADTLGAITGGLAEAFYRWGSKKESARLSALVRSYG
ncbi:MAG: ADP-ribosylglycohydrolase family protein, partial [Bacilli bacterium]|nr:ADP-ribosylglycohydrolase family protein [Bacilli bacterium]